MGKVSIELSERLSPSRILITNFWFSLAVAFGLWGIVDWLFALSYLVGSLWMSVNFWALTILVSFVTTRRYSRKWLALLAIFAKMILLYTALAYLFWVGWLNHLGLVVGITTLWMVILFKAIGIAILFRDTQ